MEQSVNQITLSESEVICSKCDGFGHIPLKIKSMDEIQEVCPKCEGNGKVDWVRNAMYEQRETWQSYSPKSPCPAIGDLWFDIGANKFNMWDGSRWLIIDWNR